MSIKQREALATALITLCGVSGWVFLLASLYGKWAAPSVL